MIAFGMNQLLQAVKPWNPPCLTVSLEHSHEVYDYSCSISDQMAPVHTHHEAHPVILISFVRSVTASSPLPVPEVGVGVVDYLARPSINWLASRLGFLNVSEEQGIWQSQGNEAREKEGRHEKRECK
jgi:hypothetical protein